MKANISTSHIRMMQEKMVKYLGWRRLSFSNRSNANAWAMSSSTDMNAIFWGPRSTKDNGVQVHPTVFPFTYEFCEEMKIHWLNKKWQSNLVQLGQETLTFKSLMMGCSGLISKTLLPLINSKLDASPSVCAFINLQKTKIIVHVITHTSYVNCLHMHLHTSPCWQTSQTFPIQGHMVKY